MGLQDAWDLIPAVTLAGWIVLAFTFFPWVQNREADTDSPSESAVKTIDEKCNGKVKQY